MKQKIPFNKIYLTGNEISYIKKALKNDHLSGDGFFTEKTQKTIQNFTGCPKVLLTHSCTAALEMSALILNIKEGDEVIMPSFTFTSTANAICLRGGIPVFVDIRKDTLNIDETLIEKSITKKTKAIVVVHYAGVACEMDVVMKIARKYKLSVIEDAAQAYGAKYKNKSLGTIGDLGCFSFHESKNIICGEGGALLINKPKFYLAAEIYREKGTDRTKFLRGEINKYSWKNIGSSYLPGETTAAFLLAQIEKATWINNQRLKIWDYYHKKLFKLEKDGLITRPFVPDVCIHNAHIYYILVSKKLDRNLILRELKSFGINAVFHYIPLDSSFAGKAYGKTLGVLNNTKETASHIIRLPIWIGLNKKTQDFVIDHLESILKINS
jgi:dTDP-4-amino-4,6-dideoxygalactose transaminase